MPVTFKTKSIKIITPAAIPDLAVVPVVEKAPAAVELSPDLRDNLDYFSGYELTLFEERAAIIEFEANQTRAYAESLAYAEVMENRQYLPGSPQYDIATELIGIEIKNETLKKELSKWN